MGEYNKTRPLVNIDDNGSHAVARVPDGRMRLFLALVLTLAALRVNYGVSNTPVPFGDETRYVSRAYQLLNGGVTTDLYTAIYAMIFTRVSPDPIHAWHIVRVISSVTSTVGLFFLLGQLYGVNAFGAFVIALYWMLNLLNTPVFQNGNVHLFGFGLMCLSGALLAPASSRYPRVFGFVLMLVAALVRVEYFLPVVLVTARRLLMSRRRLWLIAMLVLAVSVLVVPIGRKSVGAFVVWMDQYLFLGLSQGYTMLMTPGTPDADLQAFTEFDVFMNKRFPGATGFFHALLTNPGELLRYIAANGASNIPKLRFLLHFHSLLLPMSLASSDSAITYAVLWVERLCAMLGIVGAMAWFTTRIIIASRGRVCRLLLADDSCYFVLVMGIASIPAILILVPDARYWLMLEPLLLWGAAVVISRSSARLGLTRTLFSAAALALFVATTPVFSSVWNLRSHHELELVYRLREQLGTLPDRTLTVIGGLPAPLCSYAAPARFTVTNADDIPEGSSFEKFVLTRQYDLVMIDPALKTTRRYRTEHAFFDAFRRAPARFGYAPLLDFDGHAIFRRTDL